MTGPDRVFICEHLGQYGSYYPAAVEAEGNHGGRAVEYIRANPAHPLDAESLRAEVERLREALTFYRDAWKYKTNKRYGGLEWSPKEELLDDCGNVARAALQHKAGE